jgi:hypothetical protein
MGGTYNNGIIKRSISTIGWALVEEIHVHRSCSAIRRSSKVGVVHATSVLSVGDNCVILSASLVEIVGLEVTRVLGRMRTVGLVESKVVSEIMYIVYNVLVKVKKNENIQRDWLSTLASIPQASGLYRQR